MTVRTETHTLDRVLAVQVEELKAFQLEKITVIIVYLEDFKHSVFIPDRKVFAVWTEVTALSCGLQFDSIN